MKKRRKSKQTSSKSENAIIKMILAMLATAGCKLVVEVLEVVRQKLWSS